LNSGAATLVTGNPVSDGDGTRAATLLFMPGTEASFVLPDGSQQSATTLHIRATEYTVGENGQSAMPGTLPPTSAYTYAADYTADEAIAVGATSIVFNQPVLSYVDNFLDVRAGTIVPWGSYDLTKNAWIPE